MKLRERLKSETLDLHRQTEERSALMPLFRTGEWSTEVEGKYLLNLSDQRDLIDYLFEHKTVWEDVIPSANHLRTALDELNIQLAGRNDITHKRFAGSPMHVIGVAYVMLGSSMGSKMILERLGEKIPSAHHGFLGIMAGVSTNFTTFCIELENPFIDSESTIEGAKMAFAYMAEPSTAKL